LESEVSKLDNLAYIKVIGTTIGTVVSAMVGGIGLAATVLIGMMLLDIITGVMVAIINKEVTSAIGIKGLFKKGYILIFIYAVSLLGHVTKIAEFAGDGLAIMFIFMEFVSLSENGAKLGVPMPKKVKDVLAALKNEQGIEEDNKKRTELI
jgi:toxin secretion/phage lysis holin